MLACRMLRAACCALRPACCVPHAMCHMPRAMCSIPHAVYCLLCAVRCVLCAVRCALCAVGCALCAVRCVLCCALACYVLHGGAVCLVLHGARRVWHGACSCICTVHCDCPHGLLGRIVHFVNVCMTQAFSELAYRSNGIKVCMYGNAPAKHRLMLQLSTASRLCIVMIADMSVDGLQLSTVYMHSCAETNASTCYSFGHTM